MEGKGWIEIEREESGRRETDQRETRLRETGLRENEQSGTVLTGRESRASACLKGIYQFVNSEMGPDMDIWEHNHFGLDTHLEALYPQHIHVQSVCLYFVVLKNIYILLYYRP